MKTKRWVQLIAVVLTLTSIIPCFGETITTRYVYDDLNRLIREEYNDGLLFMYNYDEVGNRSSLSIGCLNEWTSPVAQYRAGEILVRFNDWVTTDRILQIISEKGAVIRGSIIIPGYSLYTVGIRNGQCVPDAVAEFSTLSEVHNAEPNLLRYPLESTCPNTTVQILGSGYVYATIQSAYNAAINGDIIQIRATNVAESLNINRDINVTLEGGYNCDFTTRTGNTSIKGTIQTFPSGGKLVVKNITLGIAPNGYEY